MGIFKQNTDAGNKKLIAAMLNLLSVMFTGTHSTLTIDYEWIELVLGVSATGTFIKTKVASRFKLIIVLRAMK